MFGKAIIKPTILYALCYISRYISVNILQLDFQNNVAQFR